MGEARSERRRQARQAAKAHKRTNAGPARPALNDVDRLVSDDEAHIRELSGEPELKWFAKLANLFADRDVPPHILFGILHRFYDLDLHAVARVCQLGVPWGALILGQLIDSNWSAHEEMNQPSATELVCALAYADPDISAQAMLIALSMTSFELAPAVHALRWAGQFKWSEITSAMEAMKDNAFWMIIPENKKWRRDLLNFDEVLNDAGINWAEGPANSTSMSPEEMHRGLKSASSLKEITIAKWRHLKNLENSSPDESVTEMTEAIATAIDAAGRFDSAISSVEGNDTRCIPYQYRISGPPGTSMVWKVPAGSNLPVPPFSPEHLNMSWDMPDWYAQAASAHMYVASFLAANGEHDRAIRSSRTALRYAEKSGLDRPIAQQAANLAHALISSHDKKNFREASDLLDSVIVYYSMVQDTKKLELARGNKKRIERLRAGGVDTVSRFGDKTFDIPEFQSGIIEI